MNGHDGPDGSPSSEISQFYDGSTIFVTGATGFLGKLLLEKLLRSSNPKRIYILLREKKGKRPEDRLRDLFDVPAFESLRRRRPSYEEKITIIEGDLHQPDLGLKQRDRDLLADEVDCVFHSGATVRFDEDLKRAAYVNVRSTRDLLRIAKGMRRLRCFVHVSTAFSNCVHRHIEERFYEPPMTGGDLLALVDSVDGRLLDEITPKLLNGNPNTYVFTKAVAEDVVRGYAGEVPVAIVRPSIVISSYREPLPGWLDNLYGPTSILLGAAFGLLRALNCDKDSPAEIVPVDYVINAMLAAGWDAANVKETKNEPCKIFNYVSSSQNLITWSKYENLARENALMVPSPLIIWHSTFVLIKSHLLWLVYTFLVQTVPAHVVDAMARLVGKEPMLVKAYKKIDKFCGAIRFFSTNTWRFSNDNLTSLWDRLGEDDRRIYPFDIASMSWEEYFKTYIVGARVYLLKDPLDTVPRGRRKLFVLKIAHYALVTVLCFIFYKMVCFLLRKVFF